MVGADHQAASLRQASYEFPEVVASQCCRALLGKALKTPAQPGTLVEGTVGPFMPEDPGGRGINEGGGILPGHVGAFGLGQREEMARSGSIVRQTGTAGKTKGLGEVARFCRDFRGLGSSVFNRDAMFLGSLKQPWDLAKGQAIEDEYRLRSKAGSPPRYHRGAVALHQ